MPTEAQLVARVLVNDDRYAYAEIVRRHQSGVRALLRRLTAGDIALADDIAQETFLIAYRRLRDFRGTARLSTWLYRIGYNAFISHARKQKKPLAGDDSVAADSVGLSQVMMRRDVNRALNFLRPEERAALILTYWEDLSQQEAADILHCPLGTVKTWSNRAKERLRQYLEGWEEGCLI